MASAPASGEALVRVRAIGVCGTDLHAFRGDQPFFSYPRVIGHELGVEVVATASDRVRVGDRCAVEPYLHCRTCRPCRAGRTNCCARLSVLGVHQDGGMTEYMTLPARALHPSSTLSFEQLALVEMLSIGAHAVTRAGVGPGDRVLVVGAGPIGLSVIQFARLTGAQVAVLEADAGRRAFTEGTTDLAGVVEPGEGDEAALRACFGGDLPDVVFDATGNRHAMARSFGLVESGGRLVLVGLFVGDLSFFDPEFHRREMTLLASRNATADDFRRVMTALEAGQVAADEWITHRCVFDAAAGAFPSYQSPGSGVIKAVIHLDGPQDGPAPVTGKI
jgi:2-desacetyl-2-hydroxyethyl bacteriochlorophyllide A dehydrogenase